MNESPYGTVTFDSNLWKLYPKTEDVYLLSVRRLDEGVSIELRVGSGLEDLSHFSFSVNNQTQQTSEDGRIVITFQDTGQAAHQESTTTICAITRSGDRTRTYSININYYPKELYAASGQSAPGWVIVRNTDLALSQAQPGDYLLIEPSDEEREFARMNWGSRIQDASSEYDRATCLAVGIIKGLEGHRGIPSDRINALSPFEQYEFARSGQGGVACENIGPVFSLACNALDIPCRVLSMFRSHQERDPGEGGYELRLSEGHVTTEIFSAELNQWIWIDPNFYILGAFLGEEGPLTMLEIHFFLNNPNRAKRLRFKCYDAEADEICTEPFETCRKRDSLTNYFKQDQSFHFKLGK
jgi:hypothetical protein